MWTKLLGGFDGVNTFPLFSFLKINTFLIVAYFGYFSLFEEKNVNAHEQQGPGARQA